MSSIVLDFFGPFYDDDKLAKPDHEDLWKYASPSNSAKPDHEDLWKYASPSNSAKPDHEDLWKYASPSKKNINGSFKSKENR